MEDTDRKEETLYMPYGVKGEREYFVGFGKKQLFHAAAGAAISLVFAAAVYFIWRSVPGFGITLLSGLGGTVSMTRKDESANLSVVDHVAMAIRFRRARKFYPYRYGKEHDWEHVLLSEAEGRD